MANVPTIRARELRFESARLRTTANETVQRSIGILKRSKGLEQSVQSSLNGSGNNNGRNRGARKNETSGS
jgi:hypothetical protein